LNDVYVILKLANSNSDYS